MPDSVPERRVRDLKLMPSSDDTAAWQNEVEPQVRNTAFFSARVEDERLLAALQQLVDQAIEGGWSVTSFVEKALQMLDEIRLTPGEKDEAFSESFDILYDINRLRLIYRTQKELAAGFRQFVEDFDEFELQAFPAWQFYRQPGAKEQNKRADHVRHEGDIRLKTDIKYWLARNSPEQGGFNNPFGPWGFNSWMRTTPVEREKAEELGLIKPGERLTVPPEYAPWNIHNAIKQLGTTSTTDLDDDQRQRIIDDCDEEGIDVVDDSDEGTMYVPEPTPQPTPQPQPEQTPTPRPKPQTAPKPQPMPEPQPTPKPRPQPSPAPESAPKPRPAPQPRPEPRPQPIPQPVPQPRPQYTPQPSPQPIPQPRITPRPPQPHPKPETKPSPAPTPQPRPEPTPRPQQQPQPRPEPKPQPQHRPEPTPAPKPTPQPKPQPTPEMTPQPKPSTEPMPAPDDSTEFVPVPVLYPTEDPEDDFNNVRTEAELDAWIERQNKKLENMSEEELLNLILGL